MGYSIIDITISGLGVWTCNGCFCWLFDNACETVLPTKEIFCHEVNLIG